MSARTRRLKRELEQRGVTREGDELIYDLRRFPPGMVAVPVVPWIYTASAQAFVALSHRLPPGSSFSLCAEGSSSVVVSRNHIVNNFLKGSGKQWLCMIDSDMVPPEHAIAQLLAAGQPIVAAKCFQRVAPYSLCAQLFDPMDASHQLGSSLVEVPRTGFGCVLIRRNVLEMMEPPWFRNTVPGMGEDFDWCDRVRELGFKIYMDQTLDVGHLGVIPIVHENAAAWQATRAGQEQIAAGEAMEETLPEWLWRQAPVPV